ncbi:MAG: DNA-dependent RNA polymerase subunit epsilon [Bacilli bacterium]
MIFKVFYQPTKSQVPVRENTQTMYVEANSETEVRRLLADRDYNIEFVQALSEAHLAYEQQSEHFHVSERA